MYGWRGTIGVIAPSVNTVLETEFHRMAPAGVNVCTTRILQQGEGREVAREMNALVADAARALKTARPDVVVYGCTSGSVVDGAKYSNDLIATVEAAAQCKAVTVFEAILSALSQLAVKKVVVVTPYTAEEHDMVCEGLCQRGIDVCTSDKLGLKESWDFAAEPLTSIYRLARTGWEKTKRSAEGIVISCTNFRALGVIRALEDDLGVPVVSSNQAALWEALRIIGCDTGAVRGCGRLFASRGDEMRKQ